MTFPAQSHTALKEWAITVRALDRGEQILLLRKGGIREEGRNFRVQYPEFLLYPTFEHQNAELLKERYHEELADILSASQAGGTITFSHWASVEEVIEVSDQERLDGLSPYCIWSSVYAQQRLRWKPRHPLSVILLRVFGLEEPVTVPYLPAYGGCKSWVDLDQSVPLGNLTPVLEEGQFRRRIAEVRDTLGLQMAAGSGEDLS